MNFDYVLIQHLRAHGLALGLVGGASVALHGEIEAHLQQTLAAAEALDASIDASLDADAEWRRDGGGRGGAGPCGEGRADLHSVE